MTIFLEKNRDIINKIIIAVGILLALFLLTATLGKLKEYRYIGSGLEAKNTITVSGQGKIERAPDTAKIAFTARNESRDIKTAQSNVSKKIDALTKALKDAGIEERYIKTSSYTSYPQYNYPQVSCTALGCPRPGSPVIRGYEVAHTIDLSVKDLDKIETVLGILGQNGVTEIQGPNLGFEDDATVAREARAEAIADAKAEARVLARALGVDLVRIVSFSEQGVAGGATMYTKDMVRTQNAAAPEVSLPIGVEDIQSHVTIVYEIR
jgi:uncharacterized protein